MVAQNQGWLQVVQLDEWEDVDILAKRTESHCYILQLQCWPPIGMEASVLSLRQRSSSSMSS